MASLSHNLDMKIEILQKTFVERLTDLMREKGYNKTALSEKAGLNRRTVNGWLMNQRSPQIDSLYKLSEHFGCTIDYLLGKKDF
jgi:transcriptional regulator with XRE-family HTH domain